jgi:hypothetical protein
MPFPAIRPIGQNPENVRGLRNAIRRGRRLVQRDCSATPGQREPLASHARGEDLRYGDSSRLAAVAVCGVLLTARQDLR